MGRSLTFGQRLALGFSLLILLSLLMSALAIYSLQRVVAAKDQAIQASAKQSSASRLEALLARRVAANRAFFLSKDEAFIREREGYRAAFDRALEQLRKTSASDDETRLIEAIAESTRVYSVAAEEVVDLVRKNTPPDQVITQFQKSVLPQHDAVIKALGDYVGFQDRHRIADLDQAARVSDTAVTGVVIMVVVGALVAVLIAFTLTRSLSGQIGSAVQHIQSSSAELQSAANQQTAGSREQVTAMNEISTTIKELLATSRQIAESAQRVSRVAEETTQAAGAGDASVHGTHETVGAIKRQVDQIVAHMLDLGRKSQQIGGILDIINELAEQTNILSINATIEAAGAGEHGRRFAVVADEIRKLADRVGGSTKEIRTLVEEIRSAVNTTVMATESGSKAVDAGTRQVGELASVFRHIVDLLATTAEAAREIELSTRQQTTAVEQVNLAVANVAQAARESEASSSQVLQTVTELTHLSRDLSRLVQTNAAA